MEKVEEQNKRIEKLEATVHYLTGLLTERQLEQFMYYLKREKGSAYEENDSIQEFQGSEDY